MTNKPRKKVVKDRKCRVCLETKPLEEFYRQKGAKEGRRNDCKKCNNAKGRRYIEENGGFHTQKLRDQRKARGGNTYAKRRVFLLTYYKNNKEHVAARDAVRKALLSGELTKTACSDCGNPKVHAHHHKGYDRENWLVITWLCQEHHRIAHHGK